MRTVRCRSLWFGVVPCQEHTLFESYENVNFSLLIKTLSRDHKFVLNEALISGFVLNPFELILIRSSRIPKMKKWILNGIIIQYPRRVYLFAKLSDALTRLISNPPNPNLLNRLNLKLSVWPSCEIRLNRKAVGILKPRTINEFWQNFKLTESLLDIGWKWQPHSVKIVTDWFQNVFFIMNWLLPVTKPVRDDS